MTKQQPDYNTKIGTPEYNSGVAAFNRKKSITANPYSRNTQSQLWRAWRKGYIDASVK